MSVIYESATRALRFWFDRRIKGPSVLDPHHFFPAGRHFAANWQAIRNEASMIARELGKIPRFHEIMPEQAAISANDGRDWRMFIMRAYGVDFIANLERCPVLASIVAASPDVLSASFSILESGKHVPAHRGPFRGILRGYLVLSMPRRDDGLAAAVLKVDGVEFRLEEGEFMLWDDTFEHEVWNEGDEVRIVLLLDIRRRGLPWDLRVMSKAIVALVRFNIRLRGTSRRS
jgi:aspartate beta-hydroxylase